MTQMLGYLLARAGIAVAAANLLTDPLREGQVTQRLLAAVQQRREFPTRVTQRMQVTAHKGFNYIFRHPGKIEAPWQLRLVTRIPGIQRLLGRMIGIGIRPEHVRRPAALIYNEGTDYEKI